MIFNFKEVLRINVKSIVLFEKTMSVLISYCADNVIQQFYSLWHYDKSIATYLKIKKMNTIMFTWIPRLVKSNK